MNLTFNQLAFHAPLQLYSIEVQSLTVLSCVLACINPA